MINERKPCPKCEKDGYLRERRPNGSTTCMWCGFKCQSSVWDQSKPSSQDAFRVWLAAYKKNYGVTGLMDGETIAEQAWQAAINYTGPDND